MGTHVQVEQVDNLVAVETISQGLTTGHSTLVTPGEAAILAGELLAIPAVWRAYQSLKDKSAASHEARASRR
jgi:hypothetical protein